MAAEALEKAGEAMGYPLKAETQGSGGAKNILTKAEIQAADGIIIAADKNVDLARFDGKPLIKTSVTSGINKPEELIQKIVDGKATVYHSEGGSDTAVDDDEKESFGRKFISTL
jgi:PTS system fructose-specific IIC component